MCWIHLIVQWIYRCVILKPVYHATQIAIIFNGDTRESKSHNQLIEVTNTWTIVNNKLTYNIANDCLFLFICNNKLFLNRWTPRFFLTISRTRTVCPVRPIVELFLLFVGHRRRRKYSDQLQIDGSVTYNVPQMQFIALLRLIVVCSIKIVVYSSTLVFAHAFSTDRSPSRPNESGVSHGESVGTS